MNIYIQRAELNDFLNSDAVKEEMKNELIDYINKCDKDDIISTEDRANCKYYKINCKFLR